MWSQRLDLKFMSHIRLIIPLFVLIFSAGCTSWQLADSTLAQGRTFTEIEYSMVLDNVAQFRALRADHLTNGMPWHLTLSSGEITIKDTITAGNPTLGYAWHPINRMIGGSATRSWQENWTAAPVTDGSTLLQLESRYREIADPTNDCWIHEGYGPAGRETASGTFGRYRVWVGTSDDDVSRLTAATLRVLGTAALAGTAALPSRAGSSGGTPASPMSAPLFLPGPTSEIQ